MTCHNCQAESKRFGRTKRGNQRSRCRNFSKTFVKTLPTGP